MINELDKSQRRLFINISFFMLFVLAGFTFNSCDGKQYKGCDCYDIESISETIAHEELIVSPTQIVATYSTDEQTGELTADGGCHANMTLVFRWAEDSKAISNVRPPIAYEFQTLFGYFPTNLGMETMTIDDEGIREYTISINEAEDKDNPSGTRYGIWLKYLNDVTTESGPIKCDITIEYNVYNETYHRDGCKD